MKKIPLEEIANLFGDADEVVAKNYLDNLVHSQHVEASAANSGEVSKGEKATSVVKHHG